MTTVDFGRTAADYARHRAGFPPSLLDRLAGYGVGGPGQTVLDLGTGTGSLARLFALGGATVTGLDPAEPLLDQARRLDREAGAEVTYVVGAAERTGLPDATFDVVSAGQCWHWFRAAEAAAEARRLLRPGGRMVIAHFDWLPLPGTVVEATERLILAHNPAWSLSGGTGLHPRWLTDLRTAGFSDLETFSYDIDVLYTHEDWVGRIRASAGVAASLPPPGVEHFSVALRAELAAGFRGDPLPVPHRVWAVVATG
ncbi:methyltransferase type 11 [Actinoplanes ianthinogenes]|uniref:Methyltransferase type 11 n=1 Tax=Actinoplanes ianthinogenes TaxID=122358 RepID=A0ABN6CMX6_9ACTN|nr:class I SAM-dependent methyltransferase [Actinoplanes ianthinogenes]BCJ46481.1 methyltransferase type 11 [Actinoplanes ianthinogenes]GGR34545.1 methyltransferase type 11 [Actinoplanes ianthinogenes]